LTAHAGKDVAKDEHSFIARGIASWYKHAGNQFGGSTEK
jgi:rare lipoprotein A (peptidoglycan hydrolase)